MVSIGATKVTPKDNILSADPEKRNCYFDHEKPLKAHKKYSQVKQELNSLSTRCDLEISRRLNGWYEAWCGRIDMNAIGLVKKVEFDMNGMKFGQES
jgi:hypothetical protein